MTDQYQVHNLKTWPEYFEAVYDGSKTFEVRNNDRGFSVDDLLLLEEWSPETKGYTGRRCIKRVTYILSNYSGLHPNYVVMGLSECHNYLRCEECDNRGLDYKCVDGRRLCSECGGSSVIAPPEDEIEVTI